jgi:hypothetical protein
VSRAQRARQPRIERARAALAWTALARTALTCTALARAALLGAALAACRGAAPTPTAAEIEAAAVRAEALQWDRVDSNAGTYVVRWRALPLLERGRDFDLELFVEAADAPGVPLEGLALAVDAEMPEHRHGMNVVPRVVELGPGRFRVEGLRFQMSGWWDLHVDLTRGPWTERAQVRIDLE